jgi:hypothetical protein
MLRLKFGNHKLGDDTAIINMGPAATCPSKVLGICDVINKGIKCYAEKAEQQYPNTVPAYRRAQETYWRNTEAERILREIAERIQSRRKETRYLRYNESGDFHDQFDVRKLSFVAEGLGTIGIITYGYTARSDLDFSDAKFLVKGSGTFTGNTGNCQVIEKSEQPPEGYLVCPGSCKRCNLCKINYKHNIAFRRH